MWEPLCDRHATGTQNRIGGHCGPRWRLSRYLWCDELYQSLFVSYSWDIASGHAETTASRPSISQCSATVQKIVVFSPHWSSWYERYPEASPPQWSASPGPPPKNTHGVGTDDTRTSFPTILQSVRSHHYLSNVFEYGTPTFRLETISQESSNIFGILVVTRQERLVGPTQPPHRQCHLTYLCVLVRIHCLLYTSHRLIDPVIWYDGFTVFVGAGVVFVRVVLESQSVISIDGACIGRFTTTRDLATW